MNRKTDHIKQPEGKEFQVTFEEDAQLAQEINEPRNETVDATGKVIFSTDQSEVGNVETTGEALAKLQTEMRKNDSAGEEVIHAIQAMPWHSEGALKAAQDKRTARESVKKLTELKRDAQRAQLQIAKTNNEIGVIERKKLQAQAAADLARQQGAKWPSWLGGAAGGLVSGFARELGTAVPKFLYNLFWGGWKEARQEAKAKKIAKSETLKN